KRARRSRSSGAPACAPAQRPRPPPDAVTARAAQRRPKTKLRAGRDPGAGRDAPMTQPTPRHFVDLWKIEAADLRTILEDAKARKAARLGWPKGQPDPDAPA